MIFKFYLREVPEYIYILIARYVVHAFNTILRRQKQAGYL